MPNPGPIKYSREEVSKTSRSIGSSLGASSIISDMIKARENEAKIRAAMLALKNTKEEEKDEGVWGFIKDTAGKVGSGLLKGLEYTSAAGVSVGNELQDAANWAGDSLGVPGVHATPTSDGGPGKTRNTGVNFGDIIANTRNRITPESVRRQTGIDGPAAATTLSDLMSTAALDPLNAVGVGVTDDIARQIGRSTGDDIARIFTREGVEAADTELARRAAQLAAEREAADLALAEAEFARGMRFRPSPAAMTRTIDDPLMAMTGADGTRSLFAGLDEVAPVAPRVRPLVAAPAPAPVAPLSVLDILRSGVDEAAVGGSAAADAIAGQRYGRALGNGGLKLAGWETGLLRGRGAQAAEAIADSTIGSTVRRLFTPGAAVRDELGRSAEEIIDVALHSGGTARRQTIDELARTLAEGEVMGPEQWDLAVNSGKKAFAQQALELGGDRVASTTARDGWVEFADGIYMPKVVAETFSRSLSKPAKDYVRAFDEAQSWMKQHLTLNPLLNPTHVPRNIFSNMLFATLNGGVDNVKYWGESQKLRNALAAVIKNGDEITEESLGKVAVRGGLKAKKVRLNETEIHRALRLHEQGLAGRGGNLFEDVGESAVKGNAFGTKRTAELNQWHEELSRGAVFLKGLDEGLAAPLAAAKSRHAMLDYSSEGLSEFERNVLQRLTLFYKFPRRAIPAGLEFVAKNPGESLMLSRAGLGADLGERNTYGEPIGAYLDTPLEAMVGTLAGVAANEEGPLVGTIDEFGGPFLTAALDIGPDARSLENIIPVLSSADRTINPDNNDPISAWFSKATSLPGRRVGKDYELTRANADLDEKVNGLLAEGRELREETALRYFARGVGIERAATMAAPDLAEILLSRGYTTNEIAAILDPSIKTGGSTDELADLIAG